MPPQVQGSRELCAPGLTITQLLLNAFVREQQLSACNHSRRCRCWVIVFQWSTHPRVAETSASAASAVALGSSCFFFFPFYGCTSSTAVLFLPRKAARQRAQTLCCLVYCCAHSRTGRIHAHADALLEACTWQRGVWSLPVVVGCARAAQRVQQQGLKG